MLGFLPWEGCVRSSRKEGSLIAGLFRFGGPSLGLHFTVPFGRSMLELFTVLVLASSLRIRVRWERINGRLRVKSIRIEWSHTWFR